MVGGGSLRTVLKEVRDDVETARVRDPAARDVSFLGILSSWGGVQALLAHRIAHRFHRRGARLAPRVIVYATRALTGIEIHPGARIGSAFFIDHGSGVVIGETTEIGSGVTVYQGVTLGGTGDQRGKRHPTIGDYVTIGSGAKLLGPINVGDGAKVGANTVVVTDVPDYATVVGNPGHIVRVEGRKPDGPDTDWIHLPDPVADAMKALSDRLAEVERRLESIDGEGPPAEVRELRPKQGPTTAGG
jgi:serine O-acetyltransferase